MNRRLPTLAALCFTVFSGSAWSAADETKTVLKEAKLGDTINVHACGDILLCGQPSKEDFELAKRRGFDVIITLRTEGEVSWDEPSFVKELGMEFHRVGFRAPPTLTDEHIEKSVKLLKKYKGKSVMLHCASANRVGAIWLAHRVINDGISLEAARKEAKTVGLRTEGFETKVLKFIKEQPKK